MKSKETKLIEDRKEGNVEWKETIVWWSNTGGERVEKNISLGRDFGI